MKLTKGSYTLEGTPTELAEFVKLTEPPLLTVAPYVSLAHAQYCEKSASNWMSIVPPRCTCGVETPYYKTYIDTKTETGSYTLPPDAFTTTYGVAPKGPIVWLPHEDTPKVSK